MKFINDGVYEKDQKVETLFTRYGEETENNREKIYSKIIVNNGLTSYYIRAYQNLPYDPLGPYSRREIFRDTKMIKVSKNTFDFYMMYLKSNNSIYLTKTQRGLLND